MNSHSESVEQRLGRLETSLARTRAVLAAVVVGAAGLAVAAASAPATELRARSLTIVDDKGTERIILGAPMPSPAGEGPRFLPSTGMMINDHNGRERWGVGVYETGQMTMGFDAAPGQGSGNRERLHLGVMPDGTSFIRFLNQRGGLAGRMVLNKQDRVALEMWDAPPGATHFRRGTLDVDGWRALPDYPVPKPPAK